MGAWLRVGRSLLAIAFTGFAIQYAICALGIAGLAAPLWAAATYFTWTAALALLLTAASLLGNRFSRAVLIGFGICLLLFAVLVYLSRLVTHPRVASSWTSGCEVLAMCGGCWILAESFPGDWKLTVEWLAAFGRMLVAIALGVFAIQHFLYSGYVASLVCAWLPWHLFWAYFTGVAMAAAALSIMTGVLVRVASVLLGCMFLLWVVLIHVPRAMALPHGGDEVTNGLVALAMGGVGFALAGRASSRSVGRL